MSSIIPSLFLMFQIFAVVSFQYWYQNIQAGIVSNKCSWAYFQPQLQPQPQPQFHPSQQPSPEKKTVQPSRANHSCGHDQWLWLLSEFEFLRKLQIRSEGDGKLFPSQFGQTDPSKGNNSLSLPFSCFILLFKAHCSLTKSPQFFMLCFFLALF